MHLLFFIFHCSLAMGLFQTETFQDHFGLKCRGSVRHVCGTWPSLHQLVIAHGCECKCGSESGGAVVVFFSLLCLFFLYGFTPTILSNRSEMSFSFSLEHPPKVYLLLSYAILSLPLKLGWWHKESCLLHLRFWFSLRKGNTHHLLDYTRMFECAHTYTLIILSSSITSAQGNMVLRLTF